MLAGVSDERAAIVNPNETNAGSQQITQTAKEVYKLYGKEDNLIWYFRTGAHSHDVCDIKQLVNVIKNHRGEEKLNDTYFKTPFNEPELIFDWKCPQAD